MRTLVILLCCVLPAHAQVVLKPVFEAERVDRFRIDGTLAVEQQGEESVEPRRLSHTVDVRLTTAQVDPAGRAIISLAFERVDVEYTVGETTERFTWPEDEVDEDSALGMAWRLLVGDVIRLTLDASGRIRAVQGTELLTQRLEAVGSEDGVAMLGLWAPESLERTIRPIWGADIGGEARAVGDAWQVSERRVISGQRVVRVVHAHDFVDHNDEVATIRSEVVIEELAARSPTQIDASIEGRGDGAMTWNMIRGVADEWTESVEISIETSFQDLEPIRTRLDRSVLIRRLPAE